MTDTNAKTATQEVAPPAADKTPEAPAPAATGAEAAAAPPGVDQQQLMQQVVDLAAALEKSEQQSLQSQQALEQAQEREKQREAKIHDERAKSVMSMTDAVLQTVAQADPELSKLPVGCAVERLMESRPEDVEQIMRIAHCCSKAARDAQQKLEEERKLHENNKLEEQYQSAIARVTPGGGTATSTHVHAASRKRQRTDAPGMSSGAAALLPVGNSHVVGDGNPYSACTSIDTSNVMSAYNSLRSGKTGNAACDQIAGILRKNAAFGHA